MDHFNVYFRSCFTVYISICGSSLSTAWSRHEKMSLHHCCSSAATLCVFCLLCIWAEISFTLDNMQNSFKISFCMVTNHPARPDKTNFSFLLFSLKCCVWQVVTWRNGCRSSSATNPWNRMTCASTTRPMSEIWTPWGTCCRKTVSDGEAEQ